MHTLRLVATETAVLVFAACDARDPVAPAAAAQVAVGGTYSGSVVVH